MSNADCLTVSDPQAERFRARKIVTQRLSMPKPPYIVLSALSRAPRCASHARSENMSEAMSPVKQSKHFLIDRDCAARQADLIQTWGCWRARCAVFDQHHARGPGWPAARAQTRSAPRHQNSRQRPRTPCRRAPDCDQGRSNECLGPGDRALPSSWSRYPSHRKGSDRARLRCIGRYSMRTEP